MNQFNPDNPLLEYIFVEMNSTELKLFFYRLYENTTELIRGYLCTRCWGLVHLGHKKTHDFHKEYIISGLQVSNETLFFQTAAKYGMIDGNKVALLRTSSELLKKTEQKTDKL